MEELFLFVLESGWNENWSERKTEAGISGGAKPILMETVHSEQATLVFQGAGSGPHKVRAGRDEHRPGQLHLMEAWRCRGLAESHGERGQRRAEACPC